MYKDYIEDLITYYHTLKREGRLARRLVRPTPTFIKEECISVFESRFEKKDLGVLLTFFRITDAADLQRAVSKCDRDRFKPLCNFLNGKTSETEDPNIDLLAWLIDFERPFVPGHYRPKKSQAVIHPKEEDAATSDDLIEENGEEAEKLLIAEEKISADVSKKIKRIRTRTAIGMVAIAVLMFAFLFRESLTNLFADNRPGCMIWAGDQYDAVECGTKHGDTIAVPYDKTMFNEFKRILRPNTDTITYYSVGKLFYFVRGGEVEVYTKEGKHPVYIHRYLKPLTAYIIDKYLAAKKF